MKFEDIGYITNLRKHGNTSMIVTVVSKNYGRLVGYVRGAMGKKTSSIYQLGNLIHIEAYSRVEENMLSFRCELVTAVAINYMFDMKKIDVVSSFCSLCNACLPEKEELGRFFYYIDSFFNFITEENWFIHYAFFEYYLLDYLGVGLDLSECSATGECDNLKYVSPKTGKAVSEEAGEPYKDRLYKFPQFIVDNNYDPSKLEIADLLAMTEYFLNKNFFMTHSLKFPEKRAILRQNVLEKN